MTSHWQVGHLNHWADFFFMPGLDVTIFLATQAWKLSSVGTDNQPLWIFLYFLSKLQICQTCHSYVCRRREGRRVETTTTHDTVCAQKPNFRYVHFTERGCFIHRGGKHLPQFVCFFMPYLASFNSCLKLWYVWEFSRVVSGLRCFFHKFVKLQVW